MELNFQTLTDDAPLLFVVPPPTPSVAPFAALGYMAGMARALGENVNILDLGLDYTRWATRKEHLLKLAASMPDQPMQVNVRAGKLSDRRPIEIANNIEEALRIMRSPYKSFDEHRWACEMLLGGVQMNNSPGQGEIVLGNYDHPWDGMELGPMIQELLGTGDLFAPFFREAAASVARQNYRMVGLSIQHSDQVLPALGFAKAIREAGFEGKIIAGGVQVSFLHPEILKKSAFFTHIDAFANRMGENLVEQMYDFFNGKIEFEEIANLTMQKDGRIKQSPGYKEPVIRMLPPPDFSGLHLDKYLVPSVTLPLRTATKCYWGKCKFCRITSDNLFENLGIISAKTLFQHMVYLYETSGADTFIMADDATPPAVLTKISEMILANDLPFRWTAIGLIPEHYIDEKVLDLWAKAGCASVAIGFESGSERMLEIMGKSNDLAHVTHILTACKRLGIMTFCYGFYGHPSETEADLRQTFEYKRANEDIATYFSAGRWLLSPYNIDFKEIDQLGISVSLPDVFPYGKEYWVEWDSPKKEAQDESIHKMQQEFQHGGGKRNHLSDWIYWGQGAHIPFNWADNSTTISY